MTGTNARIVCALLLLLLAGCTAPDADTADIPIQDIHGIALDPDHPTKLYVATHRGLFVAENDKRWSAITADPFDMMGFTMHPQDGRIMYASGHPSRVGEGWSVGVVKSTDAGRTWSTLALKDEVDFHAMTMDGSSGTHDLVYGYHAGKIHVSTDGGTSWRAQTAGFQIASLAVHPTSGDVLAATDRGVLKIGRNLTGTWELVSKDPALSVAATQKMIVSYFSGQGLSKSLDGGVWWSSLNWTVPAGDHPWGIAIHPRDANILYVGTARATIHKTVDAGATWVRIK